MVKTNLDIDPVVWKRFKEAVATKRGNSWGFLGKEATEALKLYVETHNRGDVNFPVASDP
jgi:hypothetical protein